MRGGLIWTQAAIISAGHAWAEKHGRPPSAVDWRKAGPYNPSSKTVIDRFGRWNDFLVAAGWRPRKAHRTAAWTKREIHDAVYWWRVEHGRNPTVRDWNARTDERWPSTSTVVSVFGSWNQMLEQGGFPINQRSPKQLTREQRRVYMRDWNRAKRAQGHGQIRSYWRGCRCAMCRQANARYQKTYQEARAA